jgi:hypothetical protein
MKQRTEDQPGALAAEFPNWHFWLGVSGICYARRPKSSPPKVVRAATWDELRELLEAADV